jgi:hypothetical protein
MYEMLVWVAARGCLTPSLGERGSLRVRTAAAGLQQNSRLMEISLSREIRSSRIANALVPELAQLGFSGGYHLLSALLN